MSGIADAWRRPVGWARAHPAAADTIVAVVLTAISLVFHFTIEESEETGELRDPAWWTVLLVIAATMPITYRRVRPAATLLVLVGMQIVAELLNVFSASWLAVIAAFYAVGAYTDGRRRLFTLLAAGVPIIVLFVVGVSAGEVTLADAIASLGMFTVAFVIGDNVRRRRLHLESLAERADRAEREREILARERVAEERARIARELHDIVAHSVSVMVIQATAARRSLAARPAAAEQLLANIERTGRATMDELRQVLGVLRSADAEPLAMPVPTLGDLSSLVDSSAGLPVRLAVTGDADDVPAGVGVSVYRIVQEAITNANRHAGPGASVDVHVTCTPTAVDVRIDDNGRGASAARTADGYGLLGMNERAASAGGTFAAGPRVGGGWRVVARFPLQPAVDAARLVS